MFIGAAIGVMPMMAAFSLGHKQKKGKSKCKPPPQPPQCGHNHHSHGHSHKVQFEGKITYG